jgi:thioredoxin-like negative regulator of GroEL
MNGASWTPSNPPLQRQWLQEAEHLVVHVWAAWNAYDRDFDKVMSQLRPGLEEYIRFASCDVDDPQWFEHLAKWRVRTVPAVVYLRKGRHVATSQGMLPIEPMRSILEGWIASGSR